MQSDVGLDLQMSHIFFFLFLKKSIFLLFGKALWSRSYMQLSVQAGGPDCVNSSYILGEKVVFSYTAVARHYRSRVKLDNIKFRDEYLY
jgi:hypothetical protein